MLLLVLKLVAAAAAAINQLLRQETNSQTPFSKHTRNGKHHLISCRKGRKISRNNKLPGGRNVPSEIPIEIEFLRHAAVPAAAATAAACSTDSPRMAKTLPLASGGVGGFDFCWSAMLLLLVAAGPPVPAAPAAVLFDFCWSAMLLLLLVAAGPPVPPAAAAAALAVPAAVLQLQLLLLLLLVVVMLVLASADAANLISAAFGYAAAAAAGGFAAAAGGCLACCSLIAAG